MFNWSKKNDSPSVGDKPPELVKARTNLNIFDSNWKNHSWAKAILKPFEKPFLSPTGKVIQRANCTLIFWSLAIHFIFALLMILLCGDTELNPELRKCNTCSNFPICHWNWNSIATHNFEKVNLLGVYNIVNKFDYIYIYILYYYI